MKQPVGVIAAGHEQTVHVAEEILKSGGNAFDAAVGAHLAACITEPVLSSLAGGGFLLAREADGYERLYDFFAQTPLRRIEQKEIEFFPISADFGETQQEFHIGMGAFATPGTVKGLYAIHRDLCTMPMKQLVEPAVRLARDGVTMNHFQAYILDVVSPVFTAFDESLKVYGSKEKPGNLVQEGEVLRIPEFGDFLEVLALEGEGLFYRGEVAQQVDRFSREHTGHVTRDDFLSYEVTRRKPLRVDYRNARLAVNPAPSSGGTLIAFALKLMEASDPEANPFGSSGHLQSLALAQQLTETARVDFQHNHGLMAPGAAMLDPEYLARFRRSMTEHPRFPRGTTHISIMDRKGNTAALSTSNGEGCGHMIPGTGIMMNNMLGEEDLHPEGFAKWPENRRITSMMAPAILTLAGGAEVALGSGGSNRIRTAILQVLLNLADYRMSLEDAVSRPRIHCEKNFLSVEHGFDIAQLTPVLEAWPNHKRWSRSNLFFGGTHSVMRGPDGFQGAGDPRRGGVAKVVS